MLSEKDLVEIHDTVSATLLAGGWPVGKGRISEFLTEEQGRFMMRLDDRIDQVIRDFKAGKIAPNRVTANSFKWTTAYHAWQQMAETYDEYDALHDEPIGKHFANVADEWEILEVVNMCPDKGYISYVMSAREE